MVGKIFVAILLISSSMSGCLSNEYHESENSSEPITTDIETRALIEECMTFTEMERCWLIHVPTGYDEAQNHPLIVNLHGFGGNKSALYDYSHFDVIAEETPRPHFIASSQSHCSPIGSITFKHIPCIETSMMYA